MDKEALLRELWQETLGHLAKETVDTLDERLREHKKEIEELKNKNYELAASVKFFVNSRATTDSLKVICGRISNFDKKLKRFEKLYEGLERRLDYLQGVERQLNDLQNFLKVKMNEHSR